MARKLITVLTGPPTLAVLAEMQLVPNGADVMMEWVRSRVPGAITSEVSSMWDLFPHNGHSANNDRQLTDNELLVELCGRKCYNSFGLKAGRRSNQEYIEHTQLGDIAHASIAYHAKGTFFIAGISRRMSHEMIRNYVGSDREEEGNPSQESTRFVRHHGFMVLPPLLLRAGQEEQRAKFEKNLQAAYDNYNDFVDEQEVIYNNLHEGNDPKGIERKRIYEAAAGILPQQAETSFIWTTNPMALGKLVRERSHEAADAEFQRFAVDYGRLAMSRWPNLFPQPWMQKLAAAVA
jgi:thymidylate synthase ThyX